MEKGTQKILIIVGLLVAAGIGYYFLIHKKKDELAAPASAAPFAVDDTAAYNAMSDIIGPGIMGWLATSVGRDYKIGKYKIGSRASKAETLGNLIVQVSYSKGGEHTLRDGGKSLLSQETLDGLIVNYINPLKVKYAFS